jgi:hypothetical protein
VTGDDTLRVIAHELLVSLRQDVAVDRTHRKSARARLRVLVKRVLRTWSQTRKWDRFIFRPFAGEPVKP